MTTVPTNEFPLLFSQENPYDETSLNDEVSQLCTVSHPTSPQQKITTQQPPQVDWPQPPPEQNQPQTLLQSTPILQSTQNLEFTPNLQSSPILQLLRNFSPVKRFVPGMSREDIQEEPVYRGHDVQASKQVVVQNVCSVEDVSWLWEGNNGWLPYTQSQTSSIESAFTAGKPNIKLTGGYFTGKNYIIDFCKMTQECQDKRALRKVKRIGPSTEDTPDAVLAQGLSSSDKQYNKDSHKKLKVITTPEGRRRRTMDHNTPSTNSQKSQKSQKYKYDNVQPNGAWQWFGKQKWISYNTEIQTILENEYMKNKEKEVILNHSCFSKYGPYTINLKNMTQTNAVGKVRKIRRDTKL